MTLTVTVRSSEAPQRQSIGTQGAAMGTTELVAGATDEVVIESDEFASLDDVVLFTGKALGAASLAFVRTFTDAEIPIEIVDEVQDFEPEPEPGRTMENGGTSLDELIRLNKYLIENHAVGRNRGEASVDYAIRLLEATSFTGDNVRVNEFDPPLTSAQAIKMQTLVNRAIDVEHKRAAADREAGE